MPTEKIIKPAQSKWALPNKLVSEENGTFRFRVDYLKLNSVAVQDLYPRPRLNECIDY